MGKAIVFTKKTLYSNRFLFSIRIRMQFFAPACHLIDADSKNNTIDPLKIIGGERPLRSKLYSFAGYVGKNS
jgi:hypothetical protein